MYVAVAGFRSRISITVALAALLCAACGDGGGGSGVSVGDVPDAATSGRGVNDAGGDSARRCASVQVDGEFVIEREKDFTARFRIGEPYTKTVMLFGGEAVEDDNVLSNLYIFGLDRVDAQMLAQRYADFHLCSSPGGQEAARHIVPYDILPASCDVHDRIVAALRQYHINVDAGADRTSLRFDGAALELESVTENATGADVRDQVSGQNFHLVTSVEQLTGQSVLSFGTGD